MFRKENRRNGMAFATLVGFAAITVHAYEAFQGPTELIQHDPAKASPGYTLFSPFRGQNSYLIDMHGNVVHYWPYPKGWATPGSEAIEKHARLLQDGMLLRGVIDRVNRGPMSGAIYQLVDWDGDVVWEYDEERPGYTPHHDFRMIWNPQLEAQTLLYVASKEISHDEAIALGVDPSLRDDYTSRPDGVVEVDMDGNVIWEWNISDHVIQDIDALLPNYGVISEHPGKMDPNFANGVSGDWIHINSLDYNETLDHIVVNNSTFSESYVIDHGATFVPGDPEESIALAASDAGDFIFRWGNPCVYDSGDCPSSIHEGQASTNGHQQVFFSHDIQWIREKEIGMGDDLPGAGNMLIFNNGARQLGAVYSSVIEFDPYDGPMENGWYVPEATAGYSLAPAGMGMGAGLPNQVSNQVVWTYRSTQPNSFYSSYISGAQRLPNGNTLICSGAPGHIFEVTPEGEVVWEYVSPVGDRTGDEYGIHTVMTDAAGDRTNAIFKCARYPMDYSGLEGRDLTPMGKITELWTTEPAAP
jgi:hypothetical protein